MQSATARKRSVEHFKDPPVAQALFGHVRWAWIWLILRLYVGWIWVQAGWGKLHNPAWTGAEAGTALSDWFLQHVVLPHTAVGGHVVRWGEFLVGVGLSLGIFAGLAAFFGAFMNMNYLLAGSVSTNPILLVIAILLILARKAAGWWDLDRWVLPALGTPWRPGALFRPKGAEGVRSMAEHPGRA
jgi:thiosulfate dehydrogenase [quinone] large subunit